MERYRERLESLVIENYPELLDEVKLFIEMLSVRPIKAVVVNRRVIRDPSIFIQYLKVSKLGKVRWSPYVYYTKDMNIGKTGFHHLGLYYVMDFVNSYYPYLIRQSQYDLILDIAASPGGKTFLISNYLLPDKPLIIANEPNSKRVSSLIYNINRLLLDNVIITKYRGEAFPKIDNIDLVIFDAPCTAANLFYKNPQAVLYNLLNRVRYFSKLQKKIIKNIYNILSQNGLLIYSTCTFTVEECEEVVNYALDIGFDIVEPDHIPFKYRKGIVKWNNKVYDERVRYSIRITPELNYELYDGNVGYMYIALLKKGVESE